MENIRVYKMDDYTWWASRLNKRETLDYYLKEMQLSEDDNPIEELEECNLDKEGVWWETEDAEDIERLGDYDEIIHYEMVNGLKRRNTQIGNLMRRDGEIFKYISFREALEKHGEFTEPFCLASTEW